MKMIAIMVFTLLFSVQTFAGLKTKKKAKWVNEQISTIVKRMEKNCGSKIKINIDFNSFPKDTARSDMRTYSSPPIQAVSDVCLNGGKEEASKAIKSIDIKFGKKTSLSLKGGVFSYVTTNYADRKNASTLKKECRAYLENNL